MFIETSRSTPGHPPVDRPGPPTGRGATRGAPGDARTRDRVLRRVSEAGPVTATDLAEELGLTSAGVRRHLDGLVAAGEIAVADTSHGRRGRGRPARSFVVTATGHRRLSTRYDDVATSALEFLSRRLGEEAVGDFARDRLAAIERRYAPLVDAAGPDLHDRAQALAAALAADGYAASARPVGLPVAGDDAAATDAVVGVQLCQGHCPMHDVAARFPQFCEAETAVFARLLGVHVQRLATLAGGEHVCTTYVPDHPGARHPGPDHPTRPASPGSTPEPAARRTPPPAPPQAPAPDERTPR